MTNQWYFDKYIEELGDKVSIQKTEVDKILKPKGNKKEKSEQSSSLSTPIKK